MNWTSILILVFVVAMVVGPLMLMRPTPSQARIAKLREQAQQLGLRIRLGNNPFNKDPVGLAVYSLPWKEKPKAPKQFSLFKKNYTHEIHFLDEWDWSKQDTLTATQMMSLKTVLGSLDGNISGVECNRSGVSLYWNERLSGKTADEVLSALRATLIQLSAMLE